MKAKTDTLIQALNNNFGEPFLPKGFFQARARERGHGKGLRLQIGDRDIEIDGKGHVIGAGTGVGDGKAWDIQRAVK
jgi:hypothetical protein